MGTFSKACIFGLVATVAMGGCAVEGEEEDAAGEPGLVITMQEDSSGQIKEISVPPELSFQQLEKDDDGVGIMACRVTLLYCRDPRITPRVPSFCHSGCTEKKAAEEARSLCRKTCGSNVDCSGLFVDFHPCQ